MIGAVNVVELVPLLIVKFAEVNPAIGPAAPPSTVIELPLVVIWPVSLAPNVELPPLPSVSALLSVIAPASVPEFPADVPAIRSVPVVPAFTTMLFQRLVFPSASVALAEPLPAPSVMVPPPPAAVPPRPLDAPQA